MNKVFYPIFLISFLFLSGSLAAQSEDCNVFDYLPPVIDGQQSTDDPPVPCGYTANDIYVNQCSPCGSKVSDDNCTNAPNPTICELDGFETSTANATTDVGGITNGFCGPNTGIHNNFWIGFTAQSNRISLSITTFDCPPAAGNARGVQLAICETDCFSTFRTMGVNGSACFGANGQGGLYNNNTVLTADNLVAGNPYYILVDGFAGGVCDLRIDVLEGFDLPEFETAVQDPGQLCPDVLNPGEYTAASGSGALVDVNIGGIATNDLSFIWLDPSGNPMTTTEGTFFPPSIVRGQLDGSFFGEVGTYSVQIIDNGSCCPLCTEVDLIVADPPPAAAAIISGINGMDEINCSNEVVTLEGNPDNGITPAAESWTIEDSSGERQQLAVSFVANDGRINEIDITRAIIEQYFPGILQGEANVLYGFIEDFNQLCFGDAFVTIPFDFREPDININTPADIDCATNPTVMLNAGATNTNNHNASYSWVAQDGSPIVDADTETPTVGNNGFYILTVTDLVNGCMSVDSVEVMGMVDPPSLTPILDTVLNCNNLMSVDVSSMGDAGGAAIVYSWEGPSGPIAETNPALTVTEMGDYTLTATNSSNGCQIATSFSVLMDTPTLVIDAFADSTLTCGNTSITFPAAVVNGGAGDYTYSWDDGTGEVSTDPVLTTADEGMYTLTVTDVQSGCTMTQTAEVITDISEPQIDALPTDLILNCTNDQMTSTTALATDSNGDAIPGLVYEWFDGMTSISTDANIDFTSDGTYMVVVTNPANGCTSDAMITVGIDTDAPDASIVDPANISCTAMTVTLTANSTNTEVLNYQWYNGADDTAPALGTSMTQDVTAAGDYAVVITNTENGCTALANNNVGDDMVNPTADAGMDQTLNCLNEMTGVTLDGSGSTAAGTIQYAWSDPMSAPAGATATITATMEGVYTLLVTDMDNGCDDETTVEVFGDFDVPQGLMATGGTITCDQGDIILMGSSTTTGMLDYCWTDSGNNTYLEQNPTVTSAGTYTLKVTNLANGCSATATTEVMNDSNIPSVSFSYQVGDNPQLDCNQPTITLLGESSDPNPDIILTWYDPSDMALTGNPITLNENSQVGQYTIEALNPNNNCPGESSTTITLDFTTPDIVLDAETIFCSPDDEVTLQGTDLNATPASPTAFEWFDQSMMSLGQVSNPSVSTGGTYTVIATSSINGCTVEGSLLVEENNDPPSVTVAPDFDLTCNPGEETYDLNGMASAANGSDMLAYSWTLNNMEFSTDQNPNVDAAGSYTLTVTNLESNCTESATVVVGDVREDPIPTANVQMVLNCVTPMVQLEADAVANDPIYVWTSPTGVEVAEQNPMVSESGDWVLEVTDDNGCTATFTLEVEEDFETPQNVMITGDDQITCAANTVQLMGSTSTMDVTYLWTVDEDDTYMSTETMPNVGIAGEYTLVVTGNNGCTAEATFVVTQEQGLPTAGAQVMDELTCDITSTMILGTSSAANSTFEWTGPPGFAPSTDQDIEVTREGTYTLTVTDIDNGCEAVTTAEVTLNNMDPDVMTMTTEITCVDGEVFSISASSMTDNVSYDWTGPNNFTDDVANPVIEFPGTYMVTITDPVNGCTTMMDVIVDDGRELPDTFTAEADILMLTCDDEISTLTAMASTPGEFTWTGPGIMPTAGETITVDMAGDYEVEYLDPTNGCTDIRVVSVTQDITAPMIVAGTPAELNCQTTEVAISVDNNEAIRTYEWSDPSGTALANGNEPSPTVMEPGVYSVTVTADDNGCTSVATVEVMQDNNIPISVPTSSELTCEFTTVELIGEGSTTGPTISHEWFDESGMSISTELNTTTSEPGEYTLTVSNSANQCEISEITIVGQDITEPTADAGPDDEFRCADDFVTLTGIGTGQGTLSYTWLNESSAVVGSTASIDIDQTGTFTFIVMDSDNGCTMSDQVTITPDENKPNIDVGMIETLTCDVTTVEIDASGSTGVGSLSYTWTFDGNGMQAGTDAIINVTAPGNYTLLVVDDSNGCDNTTTVTVISDTNPPTFVVSDGEIDCLEGTTDVLLTELFISDPSFSWTGPGTFTATTQNLMGVDQAGDYTVVVTDLDNGCTATQNATVTASIDAPAVSIAPSEEIDCDTEVVELTGEAEAGLSYSWTGPSASAIVSGGNTLTPTVGEGGEYFLSVTDPTNGCETISSTIVSENTNVITAFEAEGNDVNCFGPNTGSVEVSEVTGGTAPYVYSIDGGDSFSTQEEFLGLVAGSYDVVVMDANGCIFDLPLSVNPADELVLELGENQVIPFGDSITLMPTPNFDIDVITWNDSTVMGTDPSVKPVNTTSYEVTAFDEDGCIATDNITIFVEKIRPVYIPSGFSPNNDGANDFFTVYADLGLIDKIKSFSVYNRWGEKMHEIGEMTPEEALLETNGWDGNHRGKEMSPGVFVYHVLVEFIDGEEILYEGNVTLMR